jgi:4-hydroxy-3-methylbut-2-enyl diphosphate reductase
VKALVPEVDVVLILGSQNSSNSLRLQELARASGRPAYLIDSAQEIDERWFTGSETVLITAGASAPEENVQACVAHLEKRYSAGVESRTIREEHVSFPLPRELRSLTLIGQG